MKEIGYTFDVAPTYDDPDGSPDRTYAVYLNGVCVFRHTIKNFDPYGQWDDETAKAATIDGFAQKLAALMDPPP